MKRYFRVYFYGQSFPKEIMDATDCHKPTFSSLITIIWLSKGVLHFQPILGKHLIKIKMNLFEPKRIPYFNTKIATTFYIHKPVNGFLF